MRERIYVAVAVASVAGLLIGCLWASTVGGPARPGDADGLARSYEITGLMLGPGLGAGPARWSRAAPADAGPQFLGRVLRPLARVSCRVRYIFATDPTDRALLWLALHQELVPQDAGAGLAARAWTDATYDEADPYARASLDWLLEQRPPAASPAENGY